jgi:hypothetical protein
MNDSSYDELLTATVEVETSNFEAMMKLADLAVDKFKAGLKTEGKGTTYSKVGHNMIAGAVIGMERFANKVMVESLAECPEVSGTLKDSHDVLQPVRVGNKIRLEMGYGYGDAPSPVDGRRASQYAVPVHEIRDATHLPPTKDHFLIDPLLMNAAEFGSGIAAEMRVGAETTKVLGGPDRSVTIVPGYRPAGVATEIPSMRIGQTMIKGPGGRFVGST